MQYLQNKDHQHHKWQQQKSYHIQTARVRRTSSRRSICFYPSKNGRCFIPKTECPNIWIRLPRHKMAKSMVQYGRSSRSSWAKSVRPSFGRTVMGKAILGNPIEVRLGEGFQLEMLIRTPWKMVILICVCGWHKNWLGRKRSRFGRTNIFPRPCTPGVYSKTLWNKQRYCWQLQNHVWILNFRRSNWKTTMLGKSAYFFVVLWHGGSCQEMCGAILWVRKQDDSTTLQSIYSMHWWPSFQRRRIEIRGRIVKVCSQIVLQCLYLASIGRPDILWSVNKLARSITKWTKAWPGGWGPQGVGLTGGGGGLARVSNLRVCEHLFISGVAHSRVWRMNLHAVVPSSRCGKNLQWVAKEGEPGCPQG